MIEKPPFFYRTKTQKNLLTFPHAFAAEPAYDLLMERFTRELHEVGKDIHARIRKERWDRGMMRYTRRDLTALEWIGEQYVARFDQLQRLFALHAPALPAGQKLLSFSRTRALIARYQTAGLIEQGKVLDCEPKWAWLTTAGLQAVGLGYSYLRPKPGQLSHLYYINQVRFLLEQQQPAGRWISERSLRSENERREFGSKTGHIPDALFHLENTAIAIEVELTAKESRRLMQILRLIMSRYDRCWYFVNADTKSILEAARPQLGERADFLTLYDIDQFLKF